MTPLPQKKPDNNTAEQNSAPRFPSTPAPLRSQGGTPPTSTRQAAPQPPAAPPARQPVTAPVSPPAPLQSTPERQAYAVPHQEVAPSDNTDAFYAEDELEERRQRELESLSPQDTQAAMELIALIEDNEVTEVFLNSRHTTTLKRNGTRLLQRSINFSSIEAYHSVIDNIILHYTDTSERISTTESLIEGLLEFPSTNGGNSIYARVHAITPPVKAEAIVSIAKKSKKIYTIDELTMKNSMTPNMAAFLKLCGKARVTMVYSGQSGAGKTTNLEALAQEFDPTDRIILIEDTPELRIPGQDVVSVTSSSMKPGMDPNKRITMDWLVQQANRQRPDRIIVGEVRGQEMNEFLISANSGADGSMTTLHARSARGAISKMVSLCMYGDSSKNEEAILRDISSSVQIIVQLNIINGRQIVTEIVELENAVRGGSVPINQLFKYDRNTGRHVVVGRPSDDFKDYVGERGAQIDMSWFQRSPGM